MYYTVGEMAKKLEIAPSTLRYYDKELIKKQKHAVLHQIEQLKETLKVLDYKCWYYEEAQKAGTCAVHDKTAGRFCSMNCFGCV